MTDSGMRKIEAGMLIALGIFMQQVSPALAAWLEGNQMSQLFVAFAHALGALALIPIALGIYRFFTKAKTK